jgi:hypothetical protein
MWPGKLWVGQIKGILRKKPSRGRTGIGADEEEVSHGTGRFAPAFG